MQLTIPPNLELLIDKHLSTGDYTTAEEFLRSPLEAHDSEQILTEEEHQALSAHIEEGYQQSVRDKLTDSAQAKCEIQMMKDKWRISRG